MYGIYRIQQGDTIDSLSKKYGVSPEILKNLNQNSNAVYRPRWLTCRPAP